MSNINDFIDSNKYIIDNYIGENPIKNIYGSNELSPKQYGLNKMNKSRRNKKRKSK